ncbi:MAG: hypothetical protein IJ644_03270 [Oscillospiraceae bacterium]|nr:hypothetical protein [Oscillospiraceae bacterium]
MKKRNLLFPIILVILPHVIMLLWVGYWLIYHIYDILWFIPFIAEAVAGIGCGVKALHIMQMQKPDLSVKFFIRLFISVLISAVIIISEILFFDKLGSVVLIPPLCAWISSVMLGVMTENPLEGKMLVLMNLSNYFAVIYVIFIIMIIFTWHVPWVISYS